MRFAPLAALTALVAPLALVSCAEPQPLYVDQAWIRPNPNGQGPAAGYLVIHGGEAAVRLLRVTSDAAMRIEMHQSVTQDGMTTMEKIDSLDVPAKEKVTFEPGGKHLMIFNINPAAIQAGKLTMTLLFSNDDRLIVDAQIRDAGGAGAGTMSTDNMANAISGDRAP
ncbi:MAG TPA: copper chaperone PCu(A)C [Sphingobium sp.]|nr:copper chaperone PCu(A)C [Sphingobium sp.]